jgi:hypothetical protein
MIAIGLRGYILEREIPFVGSAKNVVEPGVNAAIS